MWDVAPSQPQWNVHGHVSQSQVILGVLPEEAQPDTPRPLQSTPDHVSQSGLSLGAQSPTGESESQLSAEVASDSSHTQVADCGSREESGLQPELSAVAGPSALGDGIPEESGQWDLRADLSLMVSVGPGGGGRKGEKLAVPGTWEVLPQSRHSLQAHLCHSGPGRTGDTKDCSPSQPSDSQVRADEVEGSGVGEHALLATLPTWPCRGSEPPASPLLVRGRGRCLEAELS